MIRSDSLPIILRDLGLIVQVVGIMAIASLGVPLAFQESFAIGPLLITAALSLGLGNLLYWPFRRAGEALLWHGMVVAALGWLLVAALGALPIYLTAIWITEAPNTVLEFRDPMNAIFESISGYTGTGLTMVIDADQLPRTFQWWRSFTEWVGGMGVIVLMLSIIVGPGPGAHRLYYAEAREERIHPSVRSTVHTMWWIFAVYTLVGIGLLWAAGMPIWDAINHSMTGISTGGFSVVDGSIAAYDSLAIELALLPLMVIGAISFVVHYRILRGDFSQLWRGIQTRWLLILLVVGILVLWLENRSQLLLGEFTVLRDSAFQYVSAMTATGFQTVDLGAWSPTAQLILTVGMIIGGAAGSTSGGIKVIRLILLFKGIQWQFRKIIAPRDALTRFELGGKPFDETEADRRIGNVSTIIFLWILSLGIGVIVLLQAVPSYAFNEVIFEVASAQGNIGLSVGITGPNMPLAAKLVLCFNMWIGRLEIIPVLILFRSFLRRI
ncbi:MAG: TrkH family potassium uptake protein [Candidatus Bipolaricaulia bacterium]